MKLQQQKQVTARPGEHAATALFTRVFRGVAIPENRKWYQKQKYEAWTELIALGQGNQQLALRLVGQRSACCS